MTTIELTRFRVRPDRESALLAARPGMLVTVTNDSDDDLFYDLSDAPAFPAGVDITSAVATDPNGDVVATWNGDTETTLTTGDAIAAGTTEVWTITIQAFVANIESIDTVACVASATGNGFFNGATFGNGTIVTELDDCTDIPVGQIGLVKVVDNTGSTTSTSEISSRCSPVRGTCLPPGLRRPSAESEAASSCSWSRSERTRSRRRPTRPARPTRSCRSTLRELGAAPRAV